MSADEDDSPVEPLDRIIAQYLMAEEAGEVPDRKGILNANPEHASELELFFADHDGMNAARTGVDGHSSLVSFPELPGRDTQRDEATVDSNGGTRLGTPIELRHFGDFELLEEIARGGMGIVYKARQRSLNRVVALKMILAGQLASPDDVQRFYHEAEAAANLEHPHIVPIYEVGERDGHHYYSMAYVDGDSLARRLQDGPMSPRAAAECTKTIAEAIAYAHRRGVIHRDLKPGNVLLDGRGEPRLTDFGLAKRTDVAQGLTTTGQIVGTPSYMSPEQAAGRASATHEQADIYALGAILYASLTGEPPFRGDTQVETLLQVLTEDPRPVRALNPRVPRDLETICLKCLEKKPERRYATAEDLAEDLSRFLVGEPVLARPLGAWRRVRRWARSEPGLAVTWFGVSAFYLYHLVCYLVLKQPELTPEFHHAATALAVCWCVGAAIFQRRMRGTQRELFLYLWATWDILLLTVFLFLADGAKSPLVLGYQVLVASSVVRSRTDLVGYVTGLSLAGYLIHVVYAWAYRPDLSLKFNEAFPFAVSLAVIGLIQYLALKHAQLMREPIGSRAN